MGGLLSFFRRFSKLFFFILGGVEVLGGEVRILERVGRVVVVSRGVWFGKEVSKSWGC